MADLHFDAAGKVRLCALDGTSNSSGRLASTSIAGAPSQLMSATLEASMQLIAHVYTFCCYAMM